MSVKYNIELADNISAGFWELLNENFNVILIRKQHSYDSDTLYIELEFLEMKKVNKK